MLNLKTIKLFAIIIFAAAMVSAEENSRRKIPNQAFGDRKHQVNTSFGVSIRDFKRFEDLYFWQISYGQEKTFFMLPGRLNAELMMQQGSGKYSKYDEYMAGISQDWVFPILWWLNPKPISNLYLGVGLGGYIKTNKTDRISSKFTFGQRVFLGYRIKERVAIEFYGRHFSNGTLTNQTSGYDFIGLSVMWNFSAKSL